MTDHINKVPSVPGRIGELGIFATRPISTTLLAVEEIQRRLVLVPNTPRGGPPNQLLSGKRKVRSFQTCHLPVEGHIKADDIQNVRTFGSESELVTVGQIVNDKLVEMRQSLEATLEYHRIGAIKGMVLDSDGISVITNLFSEFGISQPVFDTVLDSGATEVRQKCLQVTRLIERFVLQEQHGQRYGRCAASCDGSRDAGPREHDGRGPRIRSTEEPE